MVFHPAFFDNIAIPYVDRALPIYVKEFRIPETVETLPLFWKYAGIIQISIRLTQCIEPVRRAENSTENMALLPVKIKSKSAKTVPPPKNSAAQVRGFLKILICNLIATLKQRILNKGNITPVKMDIELLKL